MKRLGIAVVLGLSLLASGCRLFDREPVVAYPAPQYSTPYYCQPCPQVCVPTTVQCVPCTPTTARPALSR